VSDLLPAALGWTTLGIFAASAGTIAWAAAQPPYIPLPYTSQPDAGGGFTTVGGDGRIAGTELAACLAGALLVLAAGTALLLWLISWRRDLEELGAGDNKVLRTIAMNRLLRTVATMAAGLAAIAGNFACRPDPSSTTAWTNAAGLGAVAVLLAMWWWPPLRLPSLSPVPRTRGREPSARRPAALSESLGAAIGMAAVLPALASLFLLGTALPAYGAAVVPAIMAVCVLLAILGGELLLQRNYGRKDAIRGWPRRPVAPALLTATVVGSALLAGVIAVTAFGEEALDRLPPLDSDGGSNGRRRPRRSAGRLRRSQAPRDRHDSAWPGRRAARHHGLPDCPHPGGVPGRRIRRPADNGELRLDSPPGAARHTAAKLDACRRRRCRPGCRRGGDLCNSGREAGQQPRSFCPACSGGARQMMALGKRSAAARDTARPMTRGKNCPGEPISRLDA
jgi:hypothetical protein